MGLNHIKNGEALGRAAIIFCIGTAIREHVDFRVKIDALYHRIKDSEAVVFDFSLVEDESLDGEKFGLPMSFVRNLEHLGHDFYVVLSVKAEEYMRKARVHSFKAIKAEDLKVFSN